MLGLDFILQVDMFIDNPGSQLIHDLRKSHTQKDPNPKERKVDVKPNKQPTKEKKSLSWSTIA